METFVAILHMLVALILIGLVLVQDTKSGSVGVFGGGGGSNSVLGATGATTLAQKATRWAAGIFAVSCIMLSVFSTRRASSVLDNVPAASPAAPLSAPAPAPATDPMSVPGPATPQDSSTTAPGTAAPVTPPAGQ